MSNYTLELNEYGNVTDIPEGWLKTSLTVTQLKKLNIPTYKACIGFEDCCYGHWKPILVNIIPQNFGHTAEQYIKELALRKQKKKDKLISNMTVKYIAEAIYSIDKEAKRHRDLQNSQADKIYGATPCHQSRGLAHYNLHHHKNSKEGLYKLKDTALRKLIKQYNIKPIGFHVFFENNPMDMYEIEGYTFHVNGKTSTQYLGQINELIPCERKRCMPPKNAAIVLHKYIKQ